jgi:hypothetical protein
MLDKTLFGLVDAALQNEVSWSKVFHYQLADSETKTCIGYGFEKIPNDCDDGATQDPCDLNIELIIPEVSDPGCEMKIGIQ